MIVCPNCNHENPDGAVQCEACYTPLPTLRTCPGCGASVQSDASFCGQCGFDLRTLDPSGTATPQPDLPIPAAPEPTPAAAIATAEVAIPELPPPDPLIMPEPIEAEPALTSPNLDEEAEVSAEPEPVHFPKPAQPDPTMNPATAAAIAPPPPAPEASPIGTTQLQVNQAQLLHIQTNTTIDLPPHLPLIRIGKPNDRVPPDIDVSGFPNSEIVSRIHACLRVEGDVHYIEDVGSSNGTYVNNMPLPAGNRHRLRAGDRIALGKGDKVTFIFQSA